MDSPSTNQPEPQVDSSDTKRSFLAGWLFWLFFGVVFYILSIGPAFNLVWKKGNATFRPALIIYSPIVHFCVASRPADRCFHWYLKNIWDVDVLFGPPRP